MDKGPEMDRRAGIVAELMRDLALDEAERPLVEDAVMRAFLCGVRLVLSIQTVE